MQNAEYYIEYHRKEGICKTHIEDETIRSSAFCLKLYFPV